MIVRMNAADTSIERDRWNACRYRPDSHEGHYESFYLRANHPDRALAFWIRYTIFSPQGRPGDAIGELWAVWFDGEQNRITAVKEEHPIAECAFDRERLDVRIHQATLTGGKLSGKASRNQHTLAWDLAYEPDQAPLLMFPEPLYSKRLPRAKTLVPAPNALFTGKVVVDGEEHQLAQWRGSQNHNWGSKHTDAYAFGQVAGFENAPDSFLECSTAQLKIGPIWTPRMTLLVLRHDGKEYALNSIGQSLRARGSYHNFDWQWSSKTSDVEIAGRFTASPDQFVALTYYNPPGGSKTCLNTKIAEAEVTIRPQGEQPVTLKSGPRALFEILTDDASHGVPLLR